MQAVALLKIGSRGADRSQRLAFCRYDNQRPSLCCMRSSRHGADLERQKPRIPANIKSQQLFLSIMELSMYLIYFCYTGAQAAGFAEQVVSLPRRKVCISSCILMDNKHYDAQWMT